MTGILNPHRKCTNDLSSSAGVETPYQPEAIGPGPQVGRMRCLGPCMSRLARTSGI